MKIKFVINTVFPIALLILIFILNSCKDDDFFTSSSASLEFSADTVIFDTIFTSENGLPKGSITKRFKVRNLYNKTIKTNISLGDGSKGFRLNINGKASNSVKDVEIFAKDSIYIFVEITAEKLNSNNAMIIMDSIVFETNGNKQDVKLVAFGQDVNLIYAKDGVYEIEVDKTWGVDNTKPYLVYSQVLVDSSQTLTISAGTELYFHKDAGLFVYPTASLLVEGTEDEPVLMQTDRLDKIYDDVPSMWDGIRILGNSEGNKIHNAIIKNAIIGIQVGNIENESNPGGKLELHNTKIMHNSYAGIFAIASEIKATNVLIANCGYYAMTLLAGGDYQFDHTTIANYFLGYRKTPSLMIANYLIANKTEYQGNLSKADFRNCIIYGNNENEIQLSKVAGVDFEYLFDHCLIKNSSVNTTDENYFKDIITNEEPNFISTDKYNFELDTLSPAKDVGNILGGVLIKDLNGAFRDDGKPDLGAFEREEF